MVGGLETPGRTNNNVGYFEFWASVLSNLKFVRAFFELQGASVCRSSSHFAQRDERGFLPHRAVKGSHSGSVSKAAMRIPLEIAALKMKNQQIEAPTLQERYPADFTSRAPRSNRGHCARPSTQQAHRARIFLFLPLHTAARHAAVQDRGRGRPAAQAQEKPALPLSGERPPVHPEHEGMSGTAHPG